MPGALAMPWPNPYVTATGHGDERFASLSVVYVHIIPYRRINPHPESPDGQLSFSLGDRSNYCFQIIDLL
jgi:hypothetical protein